MTGQPWNDPTRPIGEILKAAGPEGIVLDFEDQGSFAVIPLDDEVIDLLIERNPEFRAHCRDSRERMSAGRFQLHQDVEKQLSGE